MINQQNNTIQPHLNKKNNFDFIRFIFASFVIISHSYPLTGIPENDLIAQITNYQLSFSNLGVKGFFIISGFLIFQSLERSENLFDYYWKRFLRLFPALFVVLFLTVLLAPFVYHNNAVPYLKNESVWSYVPNNLLLYKLQLAIPGIFENIPYKSTINGSLWTIPYEFTMYVVISILFFFRKSKIRITIIIVAALSFLILLNIFYLEELSKYGYILGAKDVAILGAFFISGSLLAVLKIDLLKYRNKLLIFSFLVIVISFPLNLFHIIQLFFLPVFIILCCVKSTPVLNSIGSKIGDLSYGIYIYAFPVQQTLEYYFEFNYLELMLSSWIASVLLAYLSWHYIEKKALQYKNVSFSTITNILLNLKKRVSGKLFTEQ